MNNINNSKTDKNENSVLLKKSSLSYYKKNETNLFSSVPVDSHVRAHPRPEGVVVRANPLGLVVKQQSVYSNSSIDLCSGENKNTAPKTKTVNHYVTSDLGSEKDSNILLASDILILS